MRRKDHINCQLIQSEIIINNHWHSALQMLKLKQWIKENQQKKLTPGEQAWHSRESTHLPPLWCRFHSWIWHQMWVEFVVCSLSLLQEVFLCFLWFCLSSKTNISKFQFNLESVPNLCSVLNTLTLK